jgi:hypothetical protein
MIRKTVPFAAGAVATGLLLALVPGNAALAYTPPMTQPEPVSVTVPNGTFEAKPAWHTDRTGANATTSTTAYSGNKSGLLYAQTAGAATMTPDAPLVDQTVKGTTYTADVFLSGNSHGDLPAFATLDEVAGGRVVSSKTVSLTAKSATYDEVTVPLVATQDGSELHISIGSGTLTKGQGVRVDDLTFVSLAAPQPIPHQTAFGSTAQPRGGTLADAVARQDAKFGHLDVLRYYAPGLPPAWSQITALGERDLVVSFKDSPTKVLSGADDAQLIAWFASAPTKPEIWWTYFHEPENDVEAGAFTAAQYRAAFAHVSDLAKQAGRSDLHATQILMGYTANPNSGRNWPDYYAGADKVDVLAWDAYNHAAADGKGYSTPENVFAKVIAASKAAGKPVAIAETGAPLLAGDNGSGRAAYLKAAGEYLKANGADFVTYYDSTQGGAYTLDDAPSIDAWKAFM